MSNGQRCRMLHFEQGAGVFEDKGVGAALLLVLVVSILAAAWMLRNAYEGDPVIYLSYAQNAAKGSLFSFNPGEFSSGGTSALWPLFLAFAFVSGPEAAPVVAKVLSAFMCLSGLAALFVVTRRMYGSTLMATVATAAAGYIAVGPSLVLYESPLVLLALALLVDSHRRRVDAPVDAGSPILGLAIAWAALPLCRPELVIVAVASMLIVLVQGDSTRNRLHTFATFVVAIIPACVYFTFSYISTGYFSTSAAARRFGLIDSGGLSSAQAFVELVSSSFSYPIASVVVLGCLGAWQAHKYRELRWLGWLTVLSVLGFAMLLTFVVPLPEGRYFLRYSQGVLLMLAITSPLGISLFLGYVSGRWRSSLLMFLVASVAVAPCVRLVRDSRDASRVALPFDVVVERAVIDDLNSLMEPGDTMLAYEVQSRYYLRGGVAQS